MKAAIRKGFELVDAYTKAELAQIKNGLVRCTERGDKLEPVPAGYEVFGATVMAVKDTLGKLHRVSSTDVVLMNSIGDVVVLEQGVYASLFTPE